MSPCEETLTAKTNKNHQIKTKEGTLCFFKKKVRRRAMRDELTDFKPRSINGYRKKQKTCVCTQKSQHNMYQYC